MIRDDLTWRTSVPPAVGWYPASINLMGGIWRWWNGERWSRPALNKDGSAGAVVQADRRPADAGEQRLIRWQHQPRDWPENARTYVRTDSET